MATPGVGQDIEDLCGRCGDTWHVVMAKMGDQVVKVVCKLCGTHHNFRGERGEKPAGGAKGSARSNRWGAVRRRKPSKTAASRPAPPVFDPNRAPRAYSGQDSYAPGERIVHATFGVGVVASAPVSGKVDVIFPAGTRTLASAKAASTLARPVAVDRVPVSDRPPDGKS